MTFTGVLGAGNAYHPTIALTGGAAEYAMDVESAACQASLCGQVTTWEMQYPQDAVCLQEGSCTDDTARVSYAAVKITRVAGGATASSTVASSL